MGKLHGVTRKIHYNKVMRVFTNGCFDVLHLGHIELLKHCAGLGEVIVGLNSDESVRRLKGSSRPLNSEHARNEVLKSIRYVSQVYVFNEDTPYRLIEWLKPDLIVKGGDYKPEEVVGNELCEVQIFNTIQGYSSTRYIEIISSTERSKA